jgi:hypothetical protein
MSMDAGGLAHMTYQSNLFDNSPHLGTPGSGFASRGKGSHIKRLSVALPPKISTIDETQQVDVGATPRTSRGHLLAGLRTAPKSATIPPANARLGLESSKYADHHQIGRVPQTATGAYFPGHAHAMSLNSGRQMYSLPEHVLAPPSIEIEGEGGIDQSYYDELVATNNYLAQRQRALQQQLMDVQAAAQQLGGMNLNGGAFSGQQYQAAPNMSLYNQQGMQGMQSIIQAVPNSPGLYQVYNPMTGQTNLVVDTAHQHSPPQSYSDLAQSPPPQTPSLHRRTSPPTEQPSRTRSPPKSTPSPPQDVEPLPPPSANAFRRGHKKSASSFSTIRTEGLTGAGGNTGPKSAGFPQTPLTGIFVPGQGQAGVKPIRQPRNPINVNELMEAPTSKHPASKNFVTRQRRRAVQDLVKAGRERQTEARTTGTASGSGSGSPGSETDFNFSVTSSDNDEVINSASSVSASGDLSKKTSLGSLRAAAVGVIGGERKEKSRERERSSVDSVGMYSVRSLSSEEGVGEIVEREREREQGQGRRKAAMLVLSSAEKRKSGVVSPGMM